MTPDQAATVRRTFRLVEAIQEQVAVLFYRRLFGLDPQIAQRFERNDVERQRKDLIQSLARSVGELDPAIDAMSAEVDAGPAPAIVGLPPEAREVAGAALLWTLERALGAAFNADVDAAWRAAFGLPAGRTRAASATVGFRRPRRPAASSSRASDTPPSRHPAPPA